MSLSPTGQMLRAEIEELISVLGIEQKESADVLTALLEELVNKPVAPLWDPQEFVTKLSREAGKEKIKAASRVELETWFTAFFPRGTPKQLTDGDLRSYLGAAINIRKAIMGNAP